MEVEKHVDTEAPLLVHKWGFPEEMTFIPTISNPFSTLYENTPNLHSKIQNISTFIKNPLLLHAIRLRMGKWAQGNAYEILWNVAKYRKTWITLPHVSSNSPGEKWCLEPQNIWWFLNLAAESWDPQPWSFFGEIAITDMRVKSQFPQVIVQDFS